MNYFVFLFPNNSIKSLNKEVKTGYSVDYEPEGASQTNIFCTLNKSFLIFISVKKISLEGSNIS